jgi:hypothetical protein
MPLNWHVSASCHCRRSNAFQNRRTPTVEIKQLLTHHRHDAVTVPDEGMAGAVDPDVAQACQKELGLSLPSTLTSLIYALTRRRISKGFSSSVLCYTASQLSFD